MSLKWSNVLGVASALTLLLANAATAQCWGGKAKPKPAVGGAGRGGAAQPSGTKGLRSTASLDRIAINWVYRDLPKAEKPGYDDVVLPLSSFVVGDGAATDSQARPAMVYFFSAADDKAQAEFERKAFEDERVGLAARFFQCIKICADDIDDKSAKAEYAAALPSVVFIGMDGKTDQMLKGPATRAEAVLAALTKTFDADFTPGINALIERQRKILDRIDKIETALADLTEDQKRAEQKSDAPRLAEIAKERTALVKEKEKILDDEQKLLDIRRKGAREVSKGAWSG